MGMFFLCIYIYTHVKHVCVYVYVFFQCHMHSWCIFMYIFLCDICMVYAFVSVHPWVLVMYVMPVSFTCPFQSHTAHEHIHTYTLNANRQRQNNHMSLTPKTSIHTIHTFMCTHTYTHQITSAAEAQLRKKQHDTLTP